MFGEIWEETASTYAQRIYFEKKIGVLFLQLTLFYLSTCMTIWILLLTYSLLSLFVKSFLVVYIITKNNGFCHFGVEFNGCVTYRIYMKKYKIGIAQCTFERDIILLLDCCSVRSTINFPVYYRSNQIILLSYLRKMKLKTKQ